jgi:hypothetical protein
MKSVIEWAEVGGPTCPFNLLPPVIAANLNLLSLPQRRRKDNLHTANCWLECPNVVLSDLVPRIVDALPLSLNDLKMSMPGERWQLNIGNAAYFHVIKS